MNFKKKLSAIKTKFKFNTPGLFPFYIAAAALLVYFYSFFNQFAYDDIQFLVENGFIHNITNIFSLLNPAEYFQKFKESSYRPVAVLTNMLISLFSGYNPLGYHLISVIFHIANCILLYFITSIIFKNKVHALFTGLLFCVYPAFSEAVLCISYNEELVSTFFFLSALLIYFKKFKFDYLLSGILLLFALLAKEMAITLLIIIAAVEFINTGYKENYLPLLNSISNKIKSKLFYFISSAAAIAIYFLLRFKIFYSQSVTDNTAVPVLLKRIIYLPYNLFQFIKISAYPLHLNADYYFSYPEKILTAENITAVILFTVLVFLCVYLKNIQKKISLGIAWFIITLIPVLNIIPINNPIAERYLYLPAIGFCFILSGVIESLNAVISGKYKISKNEVYFIIISAIVLLYSARTILRIPDWKNDENLWNATLRVNDRSHKAYNGIGLVYLEQNETEKAEISFNKAIELDNKYIVAYYNLGNIYFSLKDYEKAISIFKKAIIINPDQYIGHFNLGAVYGRISMFSEAENEFKKTIEINPYFIQTYLNLGFIYAVNGKINEAITIWEMGRKFDPANEQLISNLKKAQRIIKQ